MITAIFNSPPSYFITDGNGHIAYNLYNPVNNLYKGLCPIYTHNGDWSIINDALEPYTLYWSISGGSLYHTRGDFLKKPILIYEDLYVQLIPEFCGKGKQLRLNYLVQNEGESERKIDLASKTYASDSKDYGASLTKFTDGTGFYMKDRITGAIVNFFGINGNASDIDRFYFGDSSYSPFSQVVDNTYNDRHVWLAHSWVNRVVSPGETILLSFTIGPGTRYNSDPLPAIVTFNSKGGSLVPSTTVSLNEKATEPTVPAKDGLTFAGWFTDEEYSDEYDFDTPVTENITLYAKWTESTYAVTFDSKGGSSVESQSIEYNGKATTPTAPIKVGYTFAGWFTDQGYTNEYDFNTPVTENITLYAKWTENLPVQYTVSFNSNSGTGNMNSEEVAEGAEYTLPSNGFTAPDGKEFSGWKVGSEIKQPGDTIAVNEDVEIVAQWTDVETPVNTYTVTYDSNGGTAVTAETVAEGETATEPAAPTREGYIFEGWHKDGLSWNFDTFITENITLVAQWTEEEEPPADEYRITVIGGTADKRFAKEGDVINITANSNRNFNIWTSTPQVSIKNYRNFKTSFEMGAHDVTIKANYISYDTTPSHPHFPSASSMPEPIKQTALVVPREIKVEQEAVFVIGSKILVKNINGTESRIEMDVEPFISENRTMIPIRFVAEALGFDVSWENTTRTVTLTDKKNKVEIPVDTNKIIVNGKTYESDVAPIMKNNRTYLSISNVAKALGLKEGTEIIWKEDTKEVIIKRTVSMK